MAGDGICADALDRASNLQFPGDRRDVEQRIGRHVKRKRLTRANGPALRAVELNLSDRDQIRTVIDLDLMAVEFLLRCGGSEHVNVHDSSSAGGDDDGTADAAPDHDARRPLHAKMARKGV